MYRTNQNRGVSPRDCLDPRLLERIALRSEIPSDISEPCSCEKSSRNRGNGCGCGENNTPVESRRSRGGCGCAENNSTVETRRNTNGCGCERNTRDTELENDGYSCENYNAEFNYTHAMVYPTMQQWQNLYCVDDGFTAGTIFRELDKPFYGPKCHGGNMYE